MVLKKLREYNIYFEKVFKPIFRNCDYLPSIYNKLTYDTSFCSLAWVDVDLPIKMGKKSNIG